MQKRECSRTNFNALMVVNHRISLIKPPLLPEQIHKTKSKQIKANRNKSHFTLFSDYSRSEWPMQFLLPKIPMSLCCTRTRVFLDGRKEIIQKCLNFGSQEQQIAKKIIKKINTERRPATSDKLIFMLKSKYIYRWQSDREGSAIKHPIILSKFIFVYLAT